MRSLLRVLLKIFSQAISSNLCVGRKYESVIQERMLL